LSRVGQPFSGAWKRRIQGRESGAEDLHQALDHTGSSASAPGVFLPVRFGS
jgi:hypothetical protein